MDFHGVALDLLAPAVDALFELGARKYCARTIEQRLQQRELARGQHDLLAFHVTRRAAGSSVTRPTRTTIGAAGVTAQHGADARGELV